MNDEQKGLIRELYNEVVRTIGQYPHESPEQIMAAVAGRWHDYKSYSFYQLIRLCLELDFGITVFGEPHVRIPITHPARGVQNDRALMQRVSTETPLPFDEMDLGFERFGEGDSFFDLFENGEAGILVDDDRETANDDYAELCRLFDQRDADLAAAKS